MNKLSIKSRRRFLQNIALGGGAFALLQSSSVAEGSDELIASLPHSLNAEILPQPKRIVNSLVAFSPSNNQTIFAAGSMNKVRLYLNSLETPEAFEVIWSPTGDKSQIHAMAWSPNEEAIAFFATSINMGSIPKFASVSLYIINLVSRAVQEIVMIEEVNGQEEQVFTNINWKGGLAWLNDNTICVCSNDNAILMVDQTSNLITELTEPYRGSKIGSITRSRSNTLRYLKNNKASNNSGIGMETNACELEADEIVDYGKITTSGDKNILAKLSSDGDYIFVYTLADVMPKVYVYDFSTSEIIKKIPIFTRDKWNFHFYTPIAVLEKREIILLDMTLSVNEKQSFINRMSTCKIAKISL